MFRSFVLALCVLTAPVLAEEPSAVIHGRAAPSTGRGPRWASTVVFHLLPKHVVEIARGGTSEVYRGGRVVRTGGDEYSVVAQAEAGLAEMTKDDPAAFVRTPGGLFRALGRVAVQIDEWNADPAQLPDIEQASLAGNFYNREDWEAVPMHKEADGSWTLEARDVTDGLHRFKFVVNGKWEPGDDRTFRTDLVYVRDRLDVWGAVRPPGDAYVYRPQPAAELLEAARQKADAIDPKKRSGAEFAKYDAALDRVEDSSESLVQELYDDISAGGKKLAQVLERAKTQPEIYREPLRDVAQKLKFDLAMSTGAVDAKTGALKLIEEIAK